MHSKPRYVFPKMGRFYERVGDAGWPIFRIAYRLFFIPQGCSKLFGWLGGNIHSTAMNVIWDMQAEELGQCFSCDEGGQVCK